MGHFLPDHTQQEIQPSQTLQRDEKDSCSPRWPRTWHSAREDAYQSSHNNMQMPSPQLRVHVHRSKRTADPRKECIDRTSPDLRLKEETTRMVDEENEKNKALNKGFKWKLQLILGHARAKHTKGNMLRLLKDSLSPQHAQIGHRRQGIGDYVAGMREFV